MSDKASDYRRARARAELRADGGIPSLIIWGAVGLLGSSILYGVLMSIK